MENDWTKMEMNFKKSGDRESLSEKTCQSMHVYSMGKIQIAHTHTHARPIIIVIDL